jgi:hypothetical protein
MATAAGSPPRYEARDFSHARVEVIPDTLLTANPFKAISQLIGERAHVPKNRPGHELSDGRAN